MSVAMLARKRETAPAPKTKAPGKSSSSGLRINEPNDSFEREADRVADEVMAGGGTKRDWSLSTVNVGAALQRNCARVTTADSPGAGELRQENNVQRESADATRTGRVPLIVSQVLSSTGRPLKPNIRDFFESSFGRDFSRVRVHTDAHAAASSRAMDARAYATGEQIVFAADQYRPESRGGLHLLAHELSHVAQQSETRQPGVGSNRQGLIQRQPLAAQQQPDADAQSTDTPSLAQAATQATQKVGAPSSLKHLMFEGTLVAGQTLPGSDSDKTIHTLADTRVSIFVTASELRIDFTPGLVITSGTWPHPDMELTEASFDFTKGTFGFAAEGPNYAWWLGHAKDKLTAGLASLFGAMPAAMRKPGYNPLSDTSILNNLSAFVSNLSTPSSSPSKDMPAAKGVKTSGSVTLDGEISYPPSGRFKLVVPKGTNVTVTFNLSGGIPSKLRDIRISSVGIELWSPSHVSSNVEFRIADAGFPLVLVTGATFFSGGHLQFSYKIVSEVFGGFVRSVLGAGLVQAGLGGLAGDTALNSDQPQVHAFVDAALHSNLEPLLKDLILAHRHAIPGIDLGEALGFGPEVGDFPPPQPGAATG